MVVGALLDHGPPVRAFSSMRRGALFPGPPFSDLSIEFRRKRDRSLYSKKGAPGRPIPPKRSAPWIFGRAMCSRWRSAGRSGEQFDFVISAVPMFELYDGTAHCLARANSRGRSVIQIIYGPLSPAVKMPNRYVVFHYDFVVRNIPPAQLALPTSSLTPRDARKVAAFRKIVL